MPIVNRVVDIGSVFDQKVEVNLAEVTQGPAGENGVALRKRLAEQKLKLPILGDNPQGDQADVGVWPHSRGAKR